MDDSSKDSVTSFPAKCFKMSTSVSFLQELDKHRRAQTQTSSQTNSPGRTVIRLYKKVKLFVKNAAETQATEKTYCILTSMKHLHADYPNIDGPRMSCLTKKKLENHFWFLMEAER